MITSNKRKGRWSQSLFGSKATGKVVILEDRAEGVDHASESRGKQGGAKAGPKAIFRRSGSKMLSLLRLTNSNGKPTQKIFQLLTYQAQELRQGRGPRVLRVIERLYYPSPEISQLLR